MKAVILLIVGSAFVFVGATGLFRKGNPWGDWVRADAVVYGHDYTTTSRLSRGSHSFRTSFIPLVKYRYSVDGIEYESESVSLFSASALTLKDLDEVYAFFPVGKKIKIWYREKDPRDAYVFIDVPKWVRLQVGGAVTLGATLILWAILIFRKVNRSSHGKIAIG